jgi:leucyl-tRNA synthetase
MFTAPPDQSLEWSDEGVEGAHRFLKRLWTLGLRLAQDAKDAGLPDQGSSCAEARRELHGTLQKALFDYERQQYNTVVSACMTMANILARLDDSADAAKVRREGFGVMLRLLSPIAPHIAHTLWQELGYGEDIQCAGWPVVDESALVSDTTAYVVQVNGKKRGTIEIRTGAARAAVEQAALEDQNVRRFTEGFTVRKVVVVPDKLINIVVQ